MATKCEKHGLHYDPSVSEGCVLCRRELAPPAAQVAEKATETDSSAMRKALMVTGGLLLVSTLAFDLAHEAAANYLQAASSGDLFEDDSPSVQNMEIPVDPQLEEAMKELDILFGEDEMGAEEGDEASEEDLFD